MLLLVVCLDLWDVARLLAACKWLHPFVHSKCSHVECAGPILANSLMMTSANSNHINTSLPAGTSAYLQKLLGAIACKHEAFHCKGAADGTASLRLC